jgi:hypothetical protein
MMLKQVSSRVIYLGNGQLEIHLRLDQVQLGLGELGLRVKNEEDLLCAQFVLSFVGVKRLFRKIHGYFGGFHPKLSGFERVHGGCNV